MSMPRFDRVAGPSVGEPVREQQPVGASAVEIDAPEMLLAETCLDRTPARRATCSPAMRRTGSGIRIGALSGDDDAPDALSPQRAERQRLVHHARAGLLRRDHRLEQPAAPASRQLSQPRDVRCRSKHQDPPDEPTFAHDTVEDHAGSPRCRRATPTAPCSATARHGCGSPIWKLPLTTSTVGKASRPATPALISRRRRSMQISGR